MTGSKAQQGEERLICLWRALRQRLTEWRPDWPEFIERPSTTNDDPLGSKTLSNAEIFEAFAVALLSGNTRWDRIARIRQDLRTPFQQFDPNRFSLITDDEIQHEIVPWFRERAAGSTGLHAGLLRLRTSAARLSGAAKGHSAERYLLGARAETDGSPEDLAITLATSKRWKLPGFGVALAAEALRNLGLDLCKPDRHILRAVGSWSLLQYSRWDHRGDFTAPQAKPEELRATMFAVRSFAQANRVSVSFANSVIWTAGAVSGARLTNDQFRQLALGCGLGRTSA